MKKNNKILLILIAIIMSVSTLFLANARYAEIQEISVELNFNQYRILESEMIVNPEEQNIKEVEVSITSDKTDKGLTVKYQIGEDGEWLDYTAPFKIQDNTVVNVKYVGEDFDGPVTSREITNILAPAAKTIINGEETEFYSVQEAIDSVGTKSGAQVVVTKRTVDENITIGEDQDVILDLNGNTINEEIIETGNTEEKIIQLATTTPSIKVGNNTTILGVLTNNGKLRIKDSKANNTRKGKIEAKGNQMYTIVNKGQLIIESGIFNSVNYKGIINVESGKLEVSGGNIFGKQAGLVVNTENAGTTSIIGGNISADGIGLSGENGNITVLGETTKISGKTHGVSIGNGTTVIKDATIESTEGIGLHINSENANVTLGTKEENVQTYQKRPIILGEINGIYNEKGTINYYDGILIGKEDKTILGTITEMAPGLSVNKSDYEDDKEKVELVIPVYEEYNTEQQVVNSYISLVLAVEGTNNNTIIKPIESTTETVEVIVPTNKTIKLDLDGKTITFNNASIVNNGNLTILGTNGKLTSNITTIKNNGTLKISGTPEIEGTSEHNQDNIAITATIDNYGKYEQNGGTITSINSCPIFNEENGFVKVEDGNVTGRKYGIRNLGEANTEANPAVVVNGGTFLCTDGNAINNRSKSGLMVINGGEINGVVTDATPTVMNYSGKIIINGGTITSDTERAIYQYTGNGIIEMRGGNVTGNRGAGVQTGELKILGGTIKTAVLGAFTNAPTGILTIGSKNNTANIATPIIQCENIAVANNEGTFNFYDGIIKGGIQSITGSITATEDEYVLIKRKETIEEKTYETAVLGPSAPVVTAKLTDANGSEYVSETWTNKDIYISLESKKAGKGIIRYEWKEGTDGEWKVDELVTSNNVGIGTWTKERNSTIYFRAIDANNVPSEASSIVIRKETTPPAIAITRKDYNTFNWTATDANGIVAYQITTSSETPTTGWIEEGTLTSGSKDISAVGTYYVWAKDTAGNIGKASIGAYTVSRSEGTGSTLTTKIDGIDASTGTAVTSSTIVLNGTPVWAIATANTGYQTPVLKSGETTITASGAKVIISGNTTISSSATITTYTITYNLQGGTVATANKTSYTILTDDITLNNPTRTGYTFTGWTGSNGETLSKNVKITKGSTGNKTYTANWIDELAPVVTVTRKDYNTFNWTATDGAGVTGFQINTSSTTPTSGWTTSGTLTSGSYDITAGGTYYVWAKDAAGNIGKASIVAYTMTRSQGTGSTLTTRVDGTSASTGTAVTANTAVLNGTPVWAIATANTGYQTPVLKNGETAITASGTKVTISANTTFTSSASIITYTISYDLKGGTVATANPTSYTVTTADITLNNPTKSGYTFMGWTGSNGTTAQTSVKITKGSTGNKTYTATWADKTAPEVKITKTDYNTFSWTATDVVGVTGFQINTSSTTPTSGWTTTGTLTSGSKDISGEGTYYVWAKDAAGNVGKATIVAYTMTRSQGTGSTLTTRVDGTSASTGTAVTANTAVLNGTTVWAIATANTGYSSPVLKNGSTAITASGTKVTISANTTIASSATINSYTVTYNYSENGGTSATKTSATVNYNAAVDLTPTATKSGYTFVGWNTNKDATTALSSYKMPASNATLYAIYKKTITATFYYYNNKSTTVSKTVYNKTTSASITAPGALGVENTSSYTFRGWSTSTGATATKNLDASGSVTLSANTSYYGSYQKTFTGTFYYCTLTATTATFSGAAQSSATATAVKYVNYNNEYVHSNFTVPTAVTESTGGTAAPTYAGVAGSTSTASTVTPSTSDSDYKFYAVYTEAIKFYYYNGSAHTNTSGIRRMLSNGTNYSASISITTPTPSAYDGASFVAWSYSASEYSSTYHRTATATGEANLYAVYGKSITGTFNYHNGTAAASATASATRYYVSQTSSINTYNTNYTIPDAVKANRTISSVTYTYRGVSTANTANATVATPTTANTTFYASYSYPINIAFNGNSATSGTAPSTLSGTGYMNYSGTKVGVSKTMPSNPFTKTGYSFSGWNTNTAGSGTNYTAGTAYTFTASATLYAKWTVNKYKVTLNNQSATTAGTAAYWYKYNTTTTVNGTTIYYYLDEAMSASPMTGSKITVPTRTGYTFKGYYTATNGGGTQYIDASGTCVNSIYKVAANTTLYAYWKDETAPSLSLSRQGTVNGFKGWTLSGDVSIDATNQILTINSTSANARTPYIHVDEKYYGWSYDAYAENVISGKTTGGVHTGSAYYDTNFAAIKGSNGYSANGQSANLTLKTWTNVKQSNYNYGTGIEYFIFTAQGSTSYSVPPVKYKNMKIYGDIYAKTNYTINVTASDSGSGISVRKYAEGSKDASYFASSGTTFTGTSFTVTKMQHIQYM